MKAIRNVQNNMFHSGSKVCFKVIRRVLVVTSNCFKVKRIS